MYRRWLLNRYARNVKFGKAEAKQLWNYLFTHQNQIMALKQKRFDF